MKLHQLRTFVAVIDQGSISAAARQRASTPSTVSTHINALENEFGILLFARSHAGVVLTDTGRLLEPLARQALQSAKDFANEAASLQTRIAGQLRLACSVDAQSFEVSKIVAQLCALYPDIQLRLSRAESARIIELIRQQEADLGIIYGRTDQSDLCAHSLGRVELAIAMPVGWLSTDADPLDVISRRPWIVTGDDCPFHSPSRRFIEIHDINPPALMRADDNRTRRQLVIGGLGVSLLDRPEANHPTIAILPSERLHCELTLVYQAQREFEPLIKAARDLILQAD